MENEELTIEEITAELEAAGVDVERMLRHARELLQRLKEGKA